MKAKFFLLGLCALGLMACSIDEVSQVNDTNAIQFKATTATRAAAVTTNSIQEFTVWAWNGTNEFMDHVTATKQSNGTFTTSPYYFWPTGTVDFYALYPASVGYGVDNSTGDELAYIGGEITVETDLDGNEYPVYTGNVATADIQEDNIVIEVYIPGDTDSQIDLCYAITKEKSSGSVPMNFRHALSQVVFKAKDINADFVVDIAEVSICSVNRHGKYTLSGVSSTTTNLDTPDLGTDGISGTQGTWIDVNHKTRFEASCTPQTLDTLGTVVNITSDPLLLIPQQVEEWDPLTDTSDKELGSYIRVLCHVTQHGSTLWPNENETSNTKEVDGVNYAYIAMPVDVAWEEGYRYTYTIIFGNGLGYYPPDDPNTDLEGTPVLVPITFNVTVDEFQDATGVDVPTDTDLSYIAVSTQAQLLGAIHSGYQEICVADDIELTTYLEFTQDCILDIAEGVTLTAPNSTSKDDDAYILGTNNCYSAAIYVTGGTLTINGPGTVATTGGSESAYTEGIWVAGGTVIINSGTFKGGSWNDESTTGSESAVYVDPGAAYIYGGTFTSGDFRNGEHWAINCGNSSYKEGEAMIYCYGGTYTDGFNPADPQTDDAPSYVAEGYGVTYDESNNSYTVVYTTVTSAADLAAALAAGVSSVTIAADMTLTNYETISNDMDITIEKGVTVTYAATKSGDNTWTAFYVTGGTVNFYGEGQIKYDPAEYGSSAFYSIWVSNVDAVVNVYGGTYEGHSVCVYVQKGLANIYGGIYYSTALGSSSGAYSSLNCQDTNYTNGQADIKAYGGTYYQFDPSNPNTNDAPSYVPEGYKVVRYNDVECTAANEEGDWYTVEAE